MGLFITILHVVLCIILILIILLQPSKGSDVGAAFGGGSSSSMFGPRGAGSMLSRAPTVVAVMFMFTSITLALRSTPEKLSGEELEEGVLGGGLEDSDLGIEEAEPAVEDNVLDFSSEDANDLGLSGPSLEPAPGAEPSILSPQEGGEPAAEDPPTED